jgi:hypothetical protein
MGKGGLLKTLRAYKSTLLILALLLIIVFSIFNTKKGKIIEHATNMNNNVGKRFLEITAFIDSSNNSQAGNHVLDALDELRSKYEEHNYVIIKTHPITDYISWFSTDKKWGPLVNQDKRSPEVILKEVRDTAPIVVISVLDKTKGDTIAKGAERDFKGVIVKGSQPADINNFKNSIPLTMASNKVGEEPYVK